MMIRSVGAQSPSLAKRVFFRCCKNTSPYTHVRVYVHVLSRTVKHCYVTYTISPVICQGGFGQNSAGRVGSLGLSRNQAGTGRYALIIDTCRSLVALDDVIEIERVVASVARADRLQRWSLPLLVFLSAVERHMYMHDDEH